MVISDSDWRRVLERDASARFVYAVETTGIYCRPGCPARRPLRENVSTHPTPLAAELAGFRACKRCQPRQEMSDAADMVVEMCARLEDGPASLGELAEHVGVSPSHAQRVFVQVTGLSPKAYRDALMRRAVRRELRETQSVTDAIYAAGFSAPSRFYARVARILGMTPSAFRRGGDHATIRFAVGECSLGSILVAATQLGVCAVALGDDPEALVHELERSFPRATLVGADDGFDVLVATVVGIVEEGQTHESLPLHVRGTAFQERVWRALAEVPAGTTTTYSALAEKLGQPTASRAVASACAANSVAVLIPCHRVVRTDGGLSGYRWGVERKRVLLERERGA